MLRIAKPLLVTFFALQMVSSHSREPSAYIEKLKSMKAPSVSASTSKAWLRELEGKITLFDYFDSETKIPGANHILWKTRWIERLTNKDSLRERIFFEPGTLHLQRYELEKLQLDEKGWFDVDVENKKARFEYFKNNEWKKSEDSFKYDLLVGAMIPKYIQKNISQLLSEEELKISLAVPFMRKIYTFELKNLGEESFQNQKIVKIRMRPSSFLMRTVVSPIVFFYSPGEDKTKKIEGKVFIKKRMGSNPDKWESFEGETLFIDPPQMN